MKKQPLTPRDAARRAVFMKHVRQSPKMPREEQRRLQELLDRQDSGDLNRVESAELRRLLTEIDRKTIEMLDKAAERTAQELGTGDEPAHRRHFRSRAASHPSASK